MVIKNILLDWDGTLANTLHVWVEAFEKAFKEYDVNLAETELASMLSTKTRRLNNYLPKGHEDDFMFKVIKYAHEIVPETSNLYPETVNIVKKLKELGMKLAIVTNSDRSFINNDLKINGIEEYFDEIITAENVTRLKPDPEGMLLAIRKLNAKSEETMFVGDMLTDIEAARSAGIKCTIFHSDSNRKYLSEEELIEANPDFFIYNLNDLFDIVK